MLLRSAFPQPLNRLRKNVPAPDFTPRQRVFNPAENVLSCNDWALALVRRPQLANLDFFRSL